MRPYDPTGGPNPDPLTAVWYLDEPFDETCSPVRLLCEADVPIDADSPSKRVRVSVLLTFDNPWIPACATPIKGELIVEFLTKNNRYPSWCLSLGTPCAAADLANWLELVLLHGGLTWSSPFAYETTKGNRVEIVDDNGSLKVFICGRDVVGQPAWYRVWKPEHIVEALSLFALQYAFACRVTP